MKRFSELIPLSVIILLPILFSIALDLNPNSRSIEKNWQLLSPTSRQLENESLIDTATTILRYQPWRIHLLDLLSKIQYENKEYDEVINSLIAYSAYEDLSIEQAIRLSQSYLQLGENEKAKEIADLVVNDPTINSDQLSQLYQMQLSVDDWLGGYKTISKWHELDQGNPDVLRQLIFQQILFDPQKAKETIEKNKLSEFQSILDELELLLSSDNITYQYVLAGNIFSQFDEWKYAKQSFSSVIELDPSYAEGWAFYGNSLNKTGENGYLALERALKISPSSKITRAFLASYWRDQKDYLKSIEIYENLIKEEEGEPVWYQELGNTYIQMGDLDAAVEAFQKTTSFAPETPIYWLNLARFSGEYRYEIKTIGIPAARQALSIDELNWEVNDLLGWLYILEMDYITAERFLSIAYQANPENPLINLHLGQLYSLQDRGSLANYYLEKCISNTNDQEIISLAKKFWTP